MDKNKIFKDKANKKHNFIYDYSLVDYINAKTKVKIRCKKHDDIFEQTPHTHLRGSGCPTCGKERTQAAKTYSEETFIKKANKVHNFLYDYSKVIYKGSEIKVEIICKIHGSFLQTPNNHLRKKGCPGCKGANIAKKKRRFTTEEYIEECNKIHNHFYSYTNTVFKSANKKIEVECPKHGIFNPYAGAHFYKKTGCPKCGRKKAGESKTLTKKQFVDKVKKVHKGYYDYTNTVYTGFRNPIMIRCPKHGEFKQAPMNHLVGKGCSKCHATKSKMETDLFNFIKGYVHVEPNSRKIVKGYELDIYEPVNKIAIEFNGIYYHSDKFLDKDYHLNKTEACKEQGIKLIHVFEDEWAYKKEIVKSRLLNILGKTPNKIYARKCTIKEVPTTEAMDFLRDNHIQGALGGKVKLGLYYEEELVSLMTFGGLRVNLGQHKKEGYYEMLRFCNKLNTNVIGGASRLFKNFVKEYAPKEVLSYADYRWSNGDLYNKLGFEFIKRTEPNYFYTKGRKRENRFKYRKSELIKEGFDKNKTEREIMKERGYKRIYDCGTLKYTYKF